MLKNIIARRLLAWFLITAFVLMPVSTAYADDLDTIKNILTTDYYRPLTAQELASSSIEELLTLLKDPHTFVMNNQEEKQFLDSIEGEWALIGIGIKETTLVPLSDTSLHFYVINVVLQDSAAEAAGIQVGDYLTAIDGILTANMTLEEVYEQLNKPVGVQIQLTLKRDSQTMIKQVSPQAYQVPIITSEMLDGNILYVHLSSMGQQIDQEMGKVLRQYSNASGIILDLTGNSGGHTYSTRSLANLLLSEGRFIGFKNRSFIQWLYLTKPAAYQQPIVCLVNHESASAAEMLPAVLQDYSRALIVGETTYGKFSSQTIVSISSDLNLKYTVAQVLTPKGRNLDRIGLVPDLQMDPLPAARFAYDLLLQTTATDKNML